MIFASIIYIISACVILYDDINHRSSKDIFDVLATLVMAVTPVLNTMIACTILFKGI